MQWFSLPWIELPLQQIEHPCPWHFHRPDRQLHLQKKPWVPGLRQQYWARMQRLPQACIWWQSVAIRSPSQYTHLWHPPPCEWPLRIVRHKKQGYPGLRQKSCIPHPVLHPRSVHWNASERGIESHRWDLVLCLWLHSFCWPVHHKLLHWSIRFWASGWQWYRSFQWASDQWVFHWHQSWWPLSALQETFSIHERPWWWHQWSLPMSFLSSALLQWQSRPLPVLE